MDVVSVAIAVVAVVVSVVSLWLARGQRDAARGAAAAAGRAATAAEDAVTEARRSAAASEASVAESRRSADAAEGSLQLAAAEAERYVPVWELEWAGGDSYQLTNGGGETAFDVSVDLADVHVARGDLTHAEISPGSAVSFMAVRVMGTRDDTVTVTWSRAPGGDPLVWKRPLPPRPKR